MVNVNIFQNSLAINI